MATQRRVAKRILHKPAPIYSLPDDTLTTLLDECQHSFGAHRRALRELTKLHVENNKAFHREFISQLNRILVIFQREPSVERIIQFLVKFATSTEGKGANDTDFVTFLLHYLLDICDAKEKAARFRSCQFIGGILNTLNEEAEIEYIFL